MLASRFRSVNAVRSDRALTNDEIRKVAPSIFADEAHDSRSDRYAYIPTVDVLTKLRSEGFEPFYACQTRVRLAEKVGHTKHMLRLRHANQINQQGETNEIIMLNSHDGSSSFQLLSGMFRFVCSNGLVRGETFDDIRVHHKGNIVDRVIEGAFTVLKNFENANNERDAMRSIVLTPREQELFGRAALQLRYDDALTPAPVTERQIIGARRIEDRAPDLWTTFNRVQENLIRGGLRGKNAKGRPARTREVSGMDTGVKLNRALWTLAEGMREIKAG